MSILFKPMLPKLGQNCKFIKSSDDVYTAQFKLAGFSEKDVKITADNEFLDIKADNGDEKDEFCIALKDNVCVSSITSTMVNGLLTITMPKKQTKERISIKIN